jgi:hypothetical protein
MNPFRRTILLCAVFLLCLSSAPSLFAQASIDAARFPENTVFYALWHGAPTPSVRTVNSLYALWDDPEFAPARAAMFDDFLKDAGKSSDAKLKITREELSEYLTLLENPFSIGFVSEPPKSIATTRLIDDKHKWNGIFFIYDRTGKETLLAKAMLRVRAAEKNPPTISPVMIAGIPAVKEERKDATSYWLESGKYLISSGEPSVIEQILARMKNGAVPAASLANSAAFKEANSVLGGGIFEAFLDISGVNKLAADSSGPGGFRAGPILDAMKISALHSVAGRVVLEGSKTRMQVAFLGDASAETIFDIWDAGQAKPASLSYVTPDAVSYRETQLNLPGIYAMGMRVAKSFAQKGEDRTAMLEAVASAKLGMPVADALNSFTGELGYLQNDSSFDFSKNTYFIGVRNRENSLKVIRHVFLDEISSDVDEGGVTFLKLSSSGKQAAQNASNAIHLAVTSDMILVANQRSALNPALVQHATSAKATLLDPFMAERAKLPPTINSLSLLDFQKFDWQSLRNLPYSGTTDKKSAMKSTTPDKTVPAKPKSFVDEIDPKVFARHLHFSSGYSWKDASGIHFDGWID